MIIEVNNGGYIKIEYDGYGITVTSCDHTGQIDRLDRFYNDEIVMALNLLRYMRDNDRKSVYLRGWENAESFNRVFGNLIQNEDFEEFRIFQ